MNKARVLLAVIAIFCSSMGDAASLTPYQTGDWKRLLNERGSAPLIVHFWGVTCSECMAELPKWGKFLHSRPGVRVVLIEVEPAPDRAVMRVLKKDGLALADNRIASQFDEYSRYEIDHRWMGEIPATFLIDANGKVSRIIGATDFQMLNHWSRKRRNHSPIRHPVPQGG